MPSHANSNQGAAASAADIITMHTHSLHVFDVRAIKITYDREFNMYDIKLFGDNELEPPLTIQAFAEVSKEQPRLVVNGKQHE